MNFKITRKFLEGYMSPGEILVLKVQRHANKSNLFNLRVLCVHIDYTSSARLVDKHIKVRQGATIGPHRILSARRSGVFDL